MLGFYALYCNVDLAKRSISEEMLRSLWMQWGRCSIFMLGTSTRSESHLGVSLKTAHIAHRVNAQMSKKADCIKF